MIALALLLCQFSLLPPLSEAEAEQVRTGVGPAETMQDAAFEAILANVQRWESEGDLAAEAPEPVTVADLASLASGELTLVEGELLRAESLPAPFAELKRWIVAVPESSDDAEVFITFVLADESLAEIEALESPRIRLPARFYKVMRLPSQGEPKSYATFVGALPKLAFDAPQAAPMPLAFAWVLLGTGLLLVVFFLGVLTRASGAVGRLRAEADLSRYDPTHPLPREPAEALDVLAKLAEDESP
jgi:hypothetical protein